MGLSATSAASGVPSRFQGSGPVVFEGPGAILTAIAPHLAGLENPLQAAEVSFLYVTCVQRDGGDVVLNEV